MRYLFAVLLVSLAGCGDSGPSTAPAPRVGLQVRKADASPEYLAAHRFWRVKRSPADIEALVVLVLQQKGNTLIFVDDQGRVGISTNPQNNELYRHGDMGSWVPPLTGESQIGDHLFNIDTHQWSSQPSRDEVLLDLRAALDVADYHP